MTRLSKLGIYRLSLLSVMLSLVLSAGIVTAYPSGTYGSGTYGSCDYGDTCSISLSSDGSLNLNITPAAGGRCTITSDTASVLTDDSNGYTLTIANDSTDDSLINGSSTIDATSGTVSSPTVLSANEWGFRVDGYGGFGSGPTSSQSNIAIPSTLFSGIKGSLLTPDTIAVTSGPANPAEDTVVWFGACADTSAPSGVYTTQVIYTAVAN